MHALTAYSGITPGNRLGATVVFSLIVHAIVILGVTFVHEDRPERLVTTLDVVLVPQRSEKPPEQADFLGRASLDGGGDANDRMRPETPPPPSVAGTQEAMAVAGTAAHEPPTRPDEPAQRTGRVPDFPSTREPPAAAPGAEAPVPAGDATLEAGRTLAIARLSAEIDRKLRAYAERPRRKWISARTKEHAFAAYMDAWRRRVEQVGNLNYPHEAIRRDLSGDLLLEVALNPDGSVEDISLRRSSGEPVLDAAAVRIVELAAPFDRFPEDIATEVDVLHIQRTWIFHSDHRISTP